MLQIPKDAQRFYICPQSQDSNKPFHSDELGTIGDSYHDKLCSDGLRRPLQECSRERFEIILNSVESGNLKIQAYWDKGDWDKPHKLLSSSVAQATALQVGHTLAPFSRNSTVSV